MQIKTKPGVCPKCEQENLDYQETKKHLSSIEYLYLCECGFKGSEWHSMEFYGHTTEAGVML